MPLTKKHNSHKSKSHKSHMSKSHKSQSHSHASHNTANSNTTMHEHCVACGCKVDISNIKHTSVKGKGKLMRPCLTGVCAKGHKWFRFVKASSASTKKA